MEERTKAQNSVANIESYLNKNVKDWNMDDVEKIIKSEFKDTYFEIDVIEIVMSNNPLLEEDLLPDYVRLAFEESARYAGLKVIEIDATTDEIDKEKLISDLTNEMIESVKSDSVISKCIGLITLNNTLNYDISVFEKDAVESLEGIKRIISSFKYDEVQGVFQSVFILLEYLYYPIATLFAKDYGKTIVTKDEEFDKLLDQIAAYQIRVAEQVVKDQEEKAKEKAAGENTK